jgi:hypothetical protein
MGKFKKGTLLGSALGAGLMWMFTTKKGQEVRGKMLDHAAAVYSEVKKNAKGSKQWKNMTKQKYVKMVQKIVDEYAKNKKLSPATKKMIVKTVGSQWKQVQKLIKK